MWLFHEKVAQVRTKYKFLVKIATHRDANISGIREGRVLTEMHPLSHPIRTTTPVCVQVEISGSRRKHSTELIPASSLRTTSRLKDKGIHVIIKGELTGMVVMHIKSDGSMARVYEVGKHRSSAFYIEKEKLCVVEK